MPAKILICDDDEGILDLVNVVLTEEGYQTIPELNSINVAGVIAREHPDLILLDLWMPVLSGDQILKSLRDTPSTNKLPVIIISASNDGAIIAMNAGATDYMAKPFDLDELIVKVKHYISQR